MSVAVFHRIGTPTEDRFTHSIDQILGFEGTITFDGIYVSVFAHRTALAPRKPILFISGDQIGREGYCNKEQLLELERLGFTLGWHGWSHDRLTEINESKIRAELSKPDWVQPIYAYPHGDFSELSKEILKELGYLRAYSTTQGDHTEYGIFRTYV